MKRILILIISGLALFLSSYVGTEPNDVAYVVAMGFDKAKDGNYIVTVQFARPAQVSGGASEEGGKDGGGIVENIVVNAPDVYSALGLANHMISKKLTLAHAKLIIFSAEVAKEGIGDIMETISRNEEIRPDIYLSVARDSAREYLTNVEPVIEVNPAKYYTLIYESDNSFGVPKSTAIDFYSNCEGKDMASVLSISGIINTDDESGDKNVSSETGTAPIYELFGEDKTSSKYSAQSEETSQDPDRSEESGNSGETGGNNSVEPGSGGEDQEENKSHSEAPINESGVGYRLKNYIAGQIGINEKDKSESMGMVVFEGNGAKFITGVLETELYKILTGEFFETFLTLKCEDDKTVTVKVSQIRKPKTDIDIKNKRITVNLSLEADLYSMPRDFLANTKLDEFEKSSEQEISDACAKFIDEVVKKKNADIFGFRNKAKSKFLTNSDYNREKDKILEYDVVVNTEFFVRRTGLTIKE